MMTMRHADVIAVRLLLAFAIGLLALACASPAPLVFLGIIAFTAATAVMLHAPVWLLIGGVVAGPMMGSWLDFSAGGAIPAATIDRAMLLGAFTYLALMVLGRRRAISRPGWIEVAMAMFAVVAGISLAIRGGSLPQGVESGFRLDVVFLAQSYLLPFACFFLGKNMVSERYLKRILQLYVVVGVFIGLVAILQQFTGITWFTATRYKVIHEGRAVGTLQSAPHFGVVMSTSMIAALALVMWSRGKMAVRIAALALALMLVAVALSKTRAVYLGLMVAIMAMAFLIRKTRRFILVGAIVAVAGALIVWPAVSQLDFVRSRLMDPIPIYNRAALWGTAVNMVVHKPITGFGFGQRTFREERNDYFVRLGDVPPNFAYSLGATHSEYLHLLVTTGLLGFIPYVLIVVLLWRTGTRSFRRRDGTFPWERAIAFVALASFATYLANGFFADLHACWYASNMIFFLFGVLQACELRRQGAAAAPPEIDGIKTRA